MLEGIGIQEIADHLLVSRAVLPRDWRNFLLSLFIGNAWWSVACFSGISALEWLWRFVKSLIG